MLNDNLQRIINKIPKQPGVYRYYDNKGELLYIGKAKNLKNRVKSYFQNKNLETRILSLVEKIAHIEYTIVKNEQESLILEASLIKNKQPKYNIKLKGSDNQVFIRFTNTPIPGVFISRKNNDPKSEYLGPYNNRNRVESVLKILRQIYPYCQQKYFSKHYCNYFAIKQCKGICKKQEDINKYKSRLKKIKEILLGQNKETKEYLYNLIQKTVIKKDFALAAFYRDKLNDIENIYIKQKITLPVPDNYTLISIIKSATNDKYIFSTCIQEIFRGKTINVMNFIQTSMFYSGDIYTQIITNILEQIKGQSLNNPEVLLEIYELDVD